MKMEPLICIILINYNSYDDTVECVRSLINQEYVNYKVIVVDNYSKDHNKLKSDSFLNKHCDVILSNSNDGFAAGNNIGIRFAKEKYNPDYYWVLNNDTVVKPDCLKKLVEKSLKSKKK